MYTLRLQGLGAVLGAGNNKVGTKQGPCPGAAPWGKDVWATARQCAQGHRRGVYKGLGAQRKGMGNCF